MASVHLPSLAPAKACGEYRFNPCMPMFYLARRSRETTELVNRKAMIFLGGSVGR
jgi:hypothetical protein